MALTQPQNIRVDAFQANVRDLAQQEGTKLLMTVDKDSPEAETNAWDRLSAGDDSAKARNTASAGGETGRQFTRRTAVAASYKDHELVETQDITQMLVDPNSRLVNSMGFTAGRRKDDVIIASATGNANVTTRSGGSSTLTPTAFPAGQIIASGYASDISFDIVAQIQRLFMQNDIDPTIKKYAVVGPQQVYQLLNLTQQTSGDYVNREALQTLNASGVVYNWMGFDWIMSTRLLEPDTAQKDCIFYTERAIGLHCPQEVTTFVERDPGRQYAWRPQVEQTLGAVRVEDEQIVWFQAKDTTVA